MSAWIIYDKNGLAKCEARQLQYSGEFMGACSVSVNISSPIPIKFGLGDWLEYRGERFELNYDPSVVKVSSSNTYGEGFQYENIVFNSLADELTRCDFLDYVPKDNELHYSSLPTFSFFADSITKLADRIQANLDRVYTDDKKWTVEVHPEYVNTLNVNITASNNTVWDALGFVNSKFGANFIIRGRKITIGTTGLAVGQLFSYGKGNGLYKIERNAESSQKIITRLRAYGSTRNMPTDYYKNVSGGNIPNNMAVKNLMLPSFPVQTHDPYIDSKNIVELGIREGTVFFDGSGDLEEIYPTMEGMTAEGLKELGIAVNATGRLDEVLSAEQISDNGKFEPAEGEEQVTTPDFTITLKDVGFNLNDYLGTSAATISMKDGMCGGRDFEIVSCEKEGDSYILTCHRHYDESLDLYFPYNGYQIKGGDKFVLLNIEMPDVYIKAASQRLLNAATAYLAKNDYARYSYTLSVDNIFMARQHKEAITNEGTSIHDVIKEGDLMLFEDEDLNIDGGITISSLSIKEYADELLIPEYEITLQEEKTVGTIEKIQNQITNLVVNGGGGETVINTEQIKSIVQAVGSKLFLSKTKDDRSKGKVASDKGFEVGKFVAGASGAIIQVDAKNGQTIAELDKLYVRMKAYFETLEIINVNSVGGKMILSPAGSVTCLGVEELEDSYRCYFLGEQDGEIIENRWKEGMQAYSQMFNAKEGVSNKVSNNYYWRLVTAVSEDVVDFNNQKCHYIDLSKSDCDTNSDIPKAGDVINHRGCRNNADYMNFIEFSAVGTNAPYITLFQGVNSYSLENKEYVSFGYDQSTGRAYMNVYGDMYFGNRDGSSYIKYNPTDGLEVKGKLSVGTTYNGSEIGSLFDKQQEDLEKFTEAVTKEFENIRNEMDGAIDTWFGEETPTLGNYPAVDWTTNADKDSHLGDLFYTNDGKAYRFQYTESDGYYWATIEDSEVIKALELAQKALDTADGKRRVFIEQPYTPYDLGDLWAAGESQPLMRCINARESGSYYASDWAVADDSHAYTDAVKKDLQASINATKSELDKAIEDAEAAAKDYTDEGKAVLQLAIDEMEKSKANLDDVYTKAFEDDTITKLEARALEAAQAEAKAAQALAEEASAIYADGVVTKEEEARIEQAKANLEEAKKYAEEKANEAFNNAMEQIAGYEYLKEALKEDTTIEGGLIQSSLIKLGYTGANGYVVMAGSNGTLDSSLGDKSIAFWAGGDMLDRENGSNVSNAADFLVRMDGSGYAAGGNLSWDINGKITADPMSFFVGEDTVSALLRAFTITYNSSNAPTLITPNAPFGVFNVNGASTFASTLSVNGDITANSKLLLGDIPMYKSKDGVVYIDGHLVVKGGVTMYGVDSAEIPSLIKSLPVASTKEKGVAYFDPDFFSVSSDGKVSFIGETGGGLDITALQNYLTQNSYLNVTEGDNRYLKLSGGTVVGTANGHTQHVIKLDTANANLCDIQVKMSDVVKAGVGYSAVESLSGYRYGAFLYNAVSSSSIGVKDDGTPYYNYNTILHSGNYSSYALPLSGGTLTNTLRIDKATYPHLVLNATDSANGQSAITLAIGDAIKGYVGYSPNIGTYLYTTAKQYYLGIKDDGNIHYTKGTIWHSGNDGADSGLDADLLDGQEGSWYIRNVLTFQSNNGTSVNGGQDLNSLTYGIVSNYGSYDYWANAPTGMTYGMVLNLKSSVSNDLMGQLAWDINHHGTDSTRYLYWRANDDRNFATAKWHQIAFTDSNVASATKLQTARTIWGNSFDGTSDVYGTISDTYGILPSKDTTYDIGSSSNQYRYVYASWFGAKTSGGLYLGANNGNHLYINTNGNVTIGSSNLAGTSYKLYVSGNLLATGGITTNDSVTINGIKLSKSKDGVLYLDGNLVVKGGVTMYGTNATSSPSIFDSLPIASTTTKGIAYFDSEFFSVGSDGKVTFIGKTDGFNATELQNYLTQNSYLNTTSGDNRYLKLSGGTLTGLLSIVRAGAGIIVDRTVGVPHITYRCSGAGVGDIGVSTDGNPVFYSYNTNKWNNIWHEGNFNPSNYLPLSGGTLSSSTDAPLYINRKGSAAYSNIVYQYNGVSIGVLGFGIDGELAVRNKYSDNINYYKVWHEGNDGADSGLDADLLDGQEGSWYIRNVLTFQSNNGADVKGGKDLNSLTYGIASNYGSYDFWANAPTGMTYGMVLNLKSSVSNGLMGQLAWDINHHGTDSTRYLYWRANDDRNFATAKWHQIAFTDSNVASATKLQTARTIWGQSFDGTGNVTGSLSDVNNISMNGSISGVSAIYNNTTNGFYIGDRSGIGATDGGALIYAYGSAPISFYAGAERMTILSNGNVGIGTNTPTDKLQVNGTLRLAGDVPHTLRLHGSNSYDIGFVAGTSGHECLAFIANQAVTSFMFVQGGTALKSWGSDTWTSQTPALQIKSNSVYINSLIASNVTPTYRFLVNGTARIDRLDFSHSNEINAFYAEGEINPANLHLNYRSLGDVTLAWGGGNVGIGTTTPSHKLHVVGNTYLNGDVFVDELNTFDVLPRTNNAYSCGNSSLRWYQVYGNIGDFSGAVSMGSTLDVTGMTTMTNATITGYLRLKDSTNYGRSIYFGDGEYCYLKEASDDVMTIYAGYGIKLNTSSTSYNVSINTNLLVSGGITMYSQRSLKNIQDERGLSLGELGAIKPIRYTWKDNRDNRLHIGGIADDIQQVLPEVVYKTNDGVLTMDYGNAAFAIASSLIKPVVDHEKRIAMLEEENKQLRQEVERLKSA